MEQPSNQLWYLRKFEDGTIFGPLPLDQLVLWASSAQIAPHDAISTDQITWMKAPMLPQLSMDWLVEVTRERYYGPTTLGAVQEFIHLGEIDGDTFIINACDGSRRQIQELPGLALVPESIALEETSETSMANEPAATGISIDLQDRIRELEQGLLEERRAAEEAEDRYRELEERYRQLQEQLSSPGLSG